MESTEKTAEKQVSETKFEKPRYWMSPEELTPAYWADESIQTRNSQEFFDKPIETLEKIEAMDKTGVTRRDFLTVMGASMAMASFACARRPVNKIIPYVVQPQEMTPGNPLYFASTCRECAKSCGLLVKTREGRPIKLEGNEEHPVNNGRLCAQGQASVLNLYDPERLKQPMKGAKGGEKSSTNWADVDSLVVAALKE
ncbi:MAG: molybdopterin oxidoreductase, partial [Bacteroidetes bacterium]|nr:molybdopterin oxidoreductase [Bacteroidota bacterium]